MISVSLWGVTDVQNVILIFCGQFIYQDITRGRMLFGNSVPWEEVCVPCQGSSAGTFLGHRAQLLPSLQKLSDTPGAPSSQQHSAIQALPLLHGGNRAKNDKGQK